LDTPEHRKEKLNQLQRQQQQQQQLQLRQLLVLQLSAVSCQLSATASV